MSMKHEVQLLRLPDKFVPALSVFRAAIVAWVQLAWVQSSPLPNNAASISYPRYFMPARRTASCRKRESLFFNFISECDKDLRLPHEGCPRCVDTNPNGLLVVFRPHFDGWDCGFESNSNFLLHQMTCLESHAKRI